MFFKHLSFAVFLTIGLAACYSAAPVSTPTPAEPTATLAPPTSTPPPSAAMVNGEYITLAEYEAELARYKAAQIELGLSFTEEEARQIVLDDLIAQMLLSQAARQENFEAIDADLQLRVDALTDQLGGVEVLNQWMSAHGYDEISFRAALKRSIESAWMRDKIITGVSASAEQIHLRQILTYNEADAQIALAELNAGTDFTDLAIRYDPVTGGELGWVPQGYLLDPQADEAVFALQTGQVSAIVITEAGFHIFKAMERADHPLSPDALLAMQARALDEWLAEKRTASEIVLTP